MAGLRGACVEAGGMTEAITSVWVFNGVGARFSGGVFTTRELGEAWIAKHGLTLAAATPDQVKWIIGKAGL